MQFEQQSFCNLYNRLDLASAISILRESQRLM